MRDQIRHAVQPRRLRDHKFCRSQSAFCINLRGVGLVGQGDDLVLCGKQNAVFAGQATQPQSMYLYAFVGMGVSKRGRKLQCGAAGGVQLAPTVLLSDGNICARHKIGGRERQLLQQSNAKGEICRPEHRDVPRCLPYRCLLRRCVAGGGQHQRQTVPPAKGAQIIYPAGMRKIDRHMGWGDVRILQSASDQPVSAPALPQQAAQYTAKPAICATYQNIHHSTPFPPVLHKNFMRHLGGVFAAGTRFFSINVVYLFQIPFATERNTVMKLFASKAGQRLLAVLCAVCAALLVISAAIAAPILVRPFYYAQIAPLQLVERTGYSEAVIREAYDDVMDFLVYGQPFGTGQLAYSAEGKSHFEDCRTLFLLDFWVLGVTAVLLLTIWGLRAVLKKQSVRLQGTKHLPVFWSAVGSCCVFALLAVWGAVDFDSLFVAFHAAFFPGKSNWIFDWRTDQIINILPQQFFLHCAVLIAVLIFAANAAFIAADAIWRKKQTQA